MDQARGRSVGDGRGGPVGVWVSVGDATLTGALHSTRYDVAGIQEVTHAVQLRQELHDTNQNVLVILLYLSPERLVKIGGHVL